MSRTADQTPVPGKFVTPKWLADHWRTTEASLSQQRFRGEGPSYLRIGRKILYSLDEIRAYEAKNTVGAA